MQPNDRTHLLMSIHLMLRLKLRRTVIFIIGIYDLCHRCYGYKDKKQVVNSVCKFSFSDECHNIIRQLQIAPGY